MTQLADLARLIRSKNAGPFTLTFDVMFEKWQLTTREREVVTRLIDRQDTDTLCAAMTISPETLKTHVRNILGNAECRSRTELIAMLLNPS